MNTKKNIHRNAIDSMKSKILSELGVDITKSKIKKYDSEYVEKRLETFREK